MMLWSSDNIDADEQWAGRIYSMDTKGWFRFWADGQDGVRVHHTAQNGTQHTQNLLLVYF